MKKIYKTSDGVQYTFPANGVFVSFSPPFYEFETSDEAVQSAIEGNVRFHQGRIVLLWEEETDLIDSEELKVDSANSVESGELKVESDAVKVRNWQEAKEYLRKTFGLPHSQLRNIEAIKEEGLKRSVTFKIVE